MCVEVVHLESSHRKVPPEKKSNQKNSSFFLSPRSDVIHVFLHIARVLFENSLFPESRPY